MGIGILRSKPSKIALLLLSLFSYVSSGQLIARIISYRLGQGIWDYRATCYMALILSLLVWLSGGVAGVLIFKIGTQIRLWPVAIAMAAVHGLVATSLILLLIGRSSSYNQVAAGFSALGGITAASSYSLFLLIVAAIWKRDALP